MLSRLAERSAVWDVLIIGGGATGLGCALDAATRGYRALLVEKGDFGQATSSRSTKLIHGGVRYLQQGNIKLVRESLRERGLLLRNAPDLVHELPFIVPAYKWWEPAFYGTGLKLYDLLAGKYRLRRSEFVSSVEVARRLPGINGDGLRGGMLYYDAQFDDARLAIALARTAVTRGAAILNYAQVEMLLKKEGRVIGAVARDVETGREYEVRAKVVINATGVFTDTIRRLDDPAAQNMIAASQGAHIVLDREFLPGDTALMVPKTDDGRVLFAIPWQGKLLIGTTETAVSKLTEHPRATSNEIDYLLDHAARYLTRRPRREDVRSTFAGLRPLVRQRGAMNSALVPRDHTIAVSASGLITITGGKWTTYRKMAEDTINRAARAGELPTRNCLTAQILIHDAAPQPGSLEALVLHSVREEMARSVEDVLARRRRDLFLDARESIANADVVSRIIARELGKSDVWRETQLKSYIAVAESYLP